MQNYNLLPDVSVGSPITASEENTMRHMLNAFQNITSDGDIDVALNSGGFSINAGNQGGFQVQVAVTLAYNNTGADLDAFHIAAVDRTQMELDGADMLVADALPSIQLKETESGDVGNWAIALQPINDLSSGLVAVSGTCLASVKTDTQNTTLNLPFVEMLAGDSNLHQRPLGSAKLLYFDSALELGLITFGGMFPIQFAKATSDPSAGTLTVKLADSAGGVIGSNITVNDGGIT